MNRPPKLHIKLLWMHLNAEGFFAISVALVIVLAFLTFLAFRH